MGESLEFAHSEPGPRFSRKAIAAFIEATGVPATTALTRANNFQRHGWIKPRQLGTHDRYAAADVAASLALSGLTDAGIEDREIMAAASRALYYAAGTPEAQHRNKPLARFGQHPAGWALAGVARGEQWVLVVLVYAGPGGRKIYADVMPATEAEPLLWEPAAPADRCTSLTSVLLHTLLVPLVQTLNPLGGKL